MPPLGRSWPTYGKLKNTKTGIASCDYSLAIKPGNEQTLSLKLFALFHLNRQAEGFDFSNNMQTASMRIIHSTCMLPNNILYLKNTHRHSMLFVIKALRLCPMENPSRSRLICARASRMHFLDKTTMRKKSCSHSVLWVLCPMAYTFSSQPYSMKLGNRKLS